MSAYAHKFYEVDVNTEYGKGLWIAEVDGEDWPIRQAEIYPDIVLTVPDDMNLTDFKLPEGFQDQPYREISQSRFDELWRIVEDKCRKKYGNP